MTSPSPYGVFTLPVFIIAALVLITCAERISEDITMEVMPSLVKVGTTVIFTCRIKGIQQDTVVYIKKVLTVEGDPATIPKEQISVLTSIVDPYKTLGRFEVERTTEGADIIYQLTIRGVQHEDNGGYECSVIDREMCATKYLEVYHVPDNIEFINYNESQIFEATEGEVPADLVCVVSHLMPHADVKVVIGDRDITNDYLLTSSTNAMCTNIGMHGKTCPLYGDYNMTAEPRTYKPLYIDNDQRLTCTTQMRAFEKDVVSTSVILNVQHGPKVNCTYPSAVRENATDVRIQCTVIANPLGGPINRTWTISPSRAGPKHTLMAPHQSDEYSLEDIVVNRTTAMMTLTIWKVRRMYFLNVYGIDASNEFGAETSSIRLIEDNSEPPSDCGSSLGISAILFMSSFILALCRLQV